jgi:hypothetical protein
MSMNLHPPGFIETAGGCEGPRYTRSQPSRETAGVTLNQCEAKYNPQFQLPYRNISRYIGELSQSWDRLTAKDKQLVTDDLFKNVPGLKDKMLGKMNNQVTSSPTVLTFLRDYVSLNPVGNTKETLNAMYYPSDTIKQAIPEDKRKGMQQGIQDWSSEQCLSFHMTSKVCLFILIIGLLFFALGVTIGKNQKK